MFTCSKCVKKGCSKKETDSLPTNCPTKNDSIQNKAKELYEEDENHLIAYNAALVSIEGRGQLTRVEETIDLIKKCGFKRIGLAFCLGLKDEAATLTRILEHNELEVVSVICKNGSMPTDFVGLDETQGTEAQRSKVSCNPIAQALFLNEEKVDFTIIFGLCVGHDTLVIKHLESPCTVLIVKDKVLCHNPIGALYQADGFFKKRFFGN